MRIDEFAVDDGPGQPIVALQLRAAMQRDLAILFGQENQHRPPGIQRQASPPGIRDPLPIEFVDVITRGPLAAAARRNRDHVVSLARVALHPFDVRTEGSIVAGNAGEV